MLLAIRGLTRGEKEAVRRTQVIYLERSRLTDEPLGLVLNIFNVKSTQPVYEEEVNKMELSLEHLWEIWRCEIGVQEFQVKVCTKKKANAVVRVYRYSSRGPNNPKNRGAAVCYLKSLTGKFVGKDLAGYRILLDPNKHIVEYYEGTTKTTTATEFKDYYISITKK